MTAPFPIVGIGAAAGSLEALQPFFTYMPADRNMVFVIVQPLDPTHTSLVSDSLQKETSMTVAQAADGMQVRPNHVYLIPSHAVLTLQHGCLRLVPPESPRGDHVRIDLFL